MTGILVILAISWILLYFLEKKNLLALGFLPVGRRAGQVILGFLFSAILCLIAQGTESSLKGLQWHLNEAFTGLLVVQAFWWDLKSVLTEELVYRGAILYILIKRVGLHKGILISAAAFGVYHWFSFGVFGNPLPMIFIFLGTGLMGYAWALAFSKTKSIMLPLGLYLGWNFTHNTLLWKGPLGHLISFPPEGLN